MLLNKKIKLSLKKISTELVKQIKCPPLSDFAVKIPPSILEECPYYTNMDY